MPHCVIEYADDLEKGNTIYTTVQVVHQNLVDSKLFDPITIKTRAIPISTYLTGGDQIPFIHATIRLFEGRTSAQKKNLGNHILASLSKRYHTVDHISVEFIDMNPDCYFK